MHNISFNQRISGYFQYPVSGWIPVSGNSYPVWGRILDIKKAGLSGWISGASLLQD
jgi:hypothetical protein